MPRHKRLNLPGCIYHVIVRGLEKRKIFFDNNDYEEFLKRLKLGLEEIGCQCLAWALIPNHFHLLIRTGSKPLTDLMRKVLSGYAIYFNRRHKRYGYLYQNRYKSILCQEDSYLKELVRYIHLNPLRAKLVGDMKELSLYSWSGHSVILGNKKREWQEVDEVLLEFGKSKKTAINRYLEFINDGIGMGKREDLTGGGLRRSAGGWKGVRELKRKKQFWRGDERILGDGDFVGKVLEEHEKEMERREKLEKEGWSLEKVVEKVCKKYEVSKDDLKSTLRIKELTEARGIISYLCYNELKINGKDIAKYFGISRPAISKAIKRGNVIVGGRGIGLIS